MAKLVWRVKLVAEFQAGVTTEVEVGRFERDEQASVADLGLRLGEAKQITAALQAEMVPRQVTVVGERHRLCATCGCVLASKGYYPATFRSLFGDVPVRVRRLLVCPCCQGSGGAKSFAVLDLEAATMAPELAYVTTRYAALAPFGQVAALLSELLPISGARNAATVRNRTLRVGEAVVQLQVTKTAQQMAAKLAEPVVVGLDGGYVRSRHRQEERHFEVIAGKVIDAHGSQSRFAFARNSPTIASSAFKQALAAARCAGGYAGDGTVRRRCWAVAVAARGAAEGHGRARLVARRGALRARAAGGPRPWRGLGRHAPGRRGGSRSGACGTGAGRDAGAGSRVCAAGRSASMCATWRASGVSSGTSASCWATSSGTRVRWCITLPGADAASRSRPRSWRVQSTRSWPRV